MSVHTCGRGGGGPCQVQPAREEVPLPGGGYPTLGTTRQTWPGGCSLLGGYPTLGTPLSDLARGVPPAWGYAPIRPSQGGTPVGYPLLDLAGGVPLPGGTPSQVHPPVGPGQGVPHLRYPHPSDLARGYPLWGDPTLGTPCQTWPGGTPGQGICPRQTWPGGYPCGGTPPWVPPCTCLGWIPLPGGGPHFGKQMEYLICRGRYASCVHAGGLSCLNVKSSLFERRRITRRCKYTFKALLIHQASK